MIEIFKYTYILAYNIINAMFERIGQFTFNNNITFITPDGPRCKTLIGAVDYSWLFTYAIFLIAR